MTEYRMIPAWAKIKDEILDARTQATINLTKYRQQPCINHKQNFANSVLHLYELLRPKIKYIKTTENGKYQTLQQQLDKITRPPPNPNMKAFTYYYHQLQDACENTRHHQNRNTRRSNHATRRSMERRTTSGHKMKYIKANAKGIKTTITKYDLDWVHITDGYEGTGKTTFTWNLCKAVDPGFNPKQIVFTEDQFRYAIKTSKPGQALMLDEGALLLFKRDAMTKENKKVIRLLTTIRAHNLFLAINAPDFLNLLDKYVIQHRVRSVARVVKRGWVWWFTKPQIPLITINNKTKKYDWPDPRFRDNYPKLQGKQWREYKERKKGVVDRETDWMTVSEVAKKVNKSTVTIYNWMKEGKLEGQKINGTWNIPFHAYKELINQN